MGGFGKLAAMVMVAMACIAIAPAADLTLDIGPPAIAVDGRLSQLGRPS